MKARVVVQRWKRKLTRPPNSSISVMVERMPLPSMAMKMKLLKGVGLGVPSA